MSLAINRTYENDTLALVLLQVLVEVLIVVEVTEHHSRVRGDDAGFILKQTLYQAIFTNVTPPMSSSTYLMSMKWGVECSPSHQDLFTSYPVTVSPDNINNVDTLYNTLNTA